MALYERTVTDVYSYLASRVGDWTVAEELTLHFRRPQQKPAEILLTSTIPDSVKRQDVCVAGARHVGW